CFASGPSRSRPAGGTYFSVGAAPCPAYIQHVPRRPEVTRVRQAKGLPPPVRVVGYHKETSVNEPGAMQATQLPPADALPMEIGNPPHRFRDLLQRAIDGCPDAAHALHAKYSD